MVVEELHDGFWILQAVWVMAYSLFVDDFDCAAKCPVTFFDNIAVFSDGYDRISISNNVKNGDACLGQWL